MRNFLQSINKMDKHARKSKYATGFVDANESLQRIEKRSNGEYIMDETIEREQALRRNVIFSSILRWKRRLIGVPCKVLSVKC